MLKQTDQKTYIYNAHGHALSGHIREPFDQFIEVQAAMSLPTTGGMGRSRVENFRFQDYVSFASAETFVSGAKTETDTYTTLVTATVEDLNVMDVVTADRVIARLASSHKLDEDEPRITVLGSTIENLKICGCDVHIKYEHEMFLRLNTFEILKKEFDGNAGFRKMAADPYFAMQPKVPVDPRGVFLCSLVKEMTIDCGAVKSAGHCFEGPEFGRVYIGEVLAQYRKRTVTMLRLELGCAVVGTMVGGQGGGNGHPLP